jgi:PTS system N-acetylgalactosamine-specific IIA component
MMTSSVPPAPARCAIIAGHGDFAAGMISAVQQIAGKGDAFRGVSNRDLSAMALEEVLRTAVRENGVRVIFTDLPAGSCTIAARRVARDTPAVIVVTGANLSMLLAWALGADDSMATCEHAAERGRAALVVLPGIAPAEGSGGH